MYNKILVANRGEIALRIIRACRELNIKTVAVYSKADELSLHTKFANEAICVGPPESTKSYLNIPAIIAAAELTNADAIHPGYGFLAESSKFSNICAENGIEFIGPPPETIDAMGNKANAKETMKNIGVPVIYGSDGIVQSVQEAKDEAENSGYPVMLKEVVVRACDLLKMKIRLRMHLTLHNPKLRCLLIMEIYILKSLFKNHVILKCKY